MSPESFNALATLLRIREGASRNAAQMVLIDGIPPGEASRATGLTPAGVSNVVSRMRRGLELAVIASSGK